MTRLLMWLLHLLLLWHAWWWCGRRMPRHGTTRHHILLRLRLLLLLHAIGLLLCCHDVGLLLHLRHYLAVLIGLTCAEHATAVQLSGTLKAMSAHIPFRLECLRSPCLQQTDDDASNVERDTARRCQTLSHPSVTHLLLVHLHLQHLLLRKVLNIARESS